MRGLCPDLNLIPIPKSPVSGFPTGVSAAETAAIPGSHSSIW